MTLWKVAFLVVTGSFVVLQLKAWFWRFKYNSKYPKGPMPWPLFGNIWTIYRLHTNTERVLEDLTRRYGDVCMLWLGSWPVVIINSANAAHNILQKQGALTYSRPEYSDLRIKIGRGRLVLTPAGPDFIRLRKIYHKLLNSDTTAKSHIVLESESILFLDEVRREPSAFYESAERYALSIIFTAAYGVRLRSVHNTVVSSLFGVWDKVLKYFHPGTLILPDTFPILLRLPKWLQPWHRIASNLIGRELQIHQAFVTRLRILENDGGAPDCYGRSLLKWQEAENVDDTLMFGVLAMIIGAGSDTTSSVLQNLFKVMALHPHVVCMAQKELDAIVGRERLPTWDDEKNLVYMRALIKELHRWAPIGCLGIPHGAIGTVEYNGYMIPKGTIIFPNLVTLSKDPDRYDKPNDFEPLRFINDDLDAYSSAVHSDYMKRDHFHYGFGRRICLGLEMGEASLFIAISRILWAFNIEPREGYKLDMYDKLYGVATKPKPFQVQISLRDEAAGEVITRQVGQIPTTVEDMETDFIKG